MTGRRGREWRVQFVLVKANVFDPVFIPVPRRTMSRQSSLLAGEIVRLSGHERHPLTTFSLTRTARILAACRRDC